MKKELLPLFLAVFTALAPLGAQDRAGGETEPAPAYVPVDETQFTLDLPENGDTAAGANDDNAPVRVPGLKAVDFLKMLFFLGLMILLIYGFFLLLRKLSGRNVRQSELITIRGSRLLKGDAALHIVEIGPQMFVIGTAGQSVSLVTEITDKETMDGIRLAAPAPETGAAADFLHKLTARLRSPAPVRSPEESAEEGAEFIKKQRDRLKGL